MAGLLDEEPPPAYAMRGLLGDAPPMRGSMRQMRGLLADPTLEAGAYAPQGPTWGDLVRQYGTTAANTLLSILPGSGEVMSAQDSGRYTRQAIDSFGRGDYGATISNGAGALAAGLGAIPLVGGIARGVRGAVRAADMGGDIGRGATPPPIPMDDASRMARAKEGGYDLDTTFYRGDQKADLTEFPPGTYWARDKKYAEGRANEVGGPVYEAHLAVRKPLSYGEDAKLGDVAAIAGEIEKRYGRAAADKFVAEGVPLDGVTTAEALQRLVPRHADVPLWHGKLLGHVLESNYGDFKDILRSTGFDAIDTGRDVIKLTSEGIRHPSAAFDPAKASSPNIFATVAPVGLLGLGAAYSLPENLEK